MDALRRLTRGQIGGIMNPLIILDADSHPPKKCEMIHQSKVSFLSDRMIRIALTTLSSILIQFTAACASPPGGDWSQWRGPTRNGVAGSGPALADAWPDGGPRMLWQSQPLSRNVKEGSSGGYSSIVVTAGRVYIFLNRKIDAEPKDESPPDVTATDVVVCFDALSGAELWKVEYPGRPRHWGTSSTPCIADGHCFVVGSLGHVYCLNARDGTEVWKVKPGGDEVSSSIEVADGKVVVMCRPLTALDPANGNILWQQPQVSGSDNSSCVWRQRDKTYFICNDGQKKKTICVDAADGSVLWTTQGGGKSTAVVAEDTMVVNAPTAMSAYRLASDGPQLLWVNKQLKDQSESPVIYNGHVYHIGGHGQVACIESTTGEIAWQGEIGDTEIASPIIVDDKIIAVLEYGNKLAMFTATPQKHERLAKADLSLLAAASPAVADGKLYLRTKHAVACYDLVQPQGE